LDLFGATLDLLTWFVVASQGCQIERSAYFRTAEKNTDLAGISAAERAVPPII
jgi:hypothetical protein